MPRKNPGQLLRNRARRLSLKWEAIRRNPDYQVDFRKYSNYLKKRKKGQYELLSDAECKLADELPVKWDLNNVLDPNLSFEQYFSSRIPLSEAKKIISLFRHSPVYCFEAINVIENPHRHEIQMPRPKKGIARKHVESWVRFDVPWLEPSATLKIDLREKRESILMDVDGIIIYLQKMMQKFFNKKVQMFKLGAYEGEAFKAYDEGQKIKNEHGKINWTKLATVLSICKDADLSTKAKQAKRLYSRAEKLIMGGFRTLR